MSASNQSTSLLGLQTSYDHQFIGGNNNYDLSKFCILIALFVVKSEFFIILFKRKNSKLITIYNRLFKIFIKSWKWTKYIKILISPIAKKSWIIIKEKMLVYVFFGVNMRDASMQGNHDSCHKTVIITVGGLALDQASALTDRHVGGRLNVG